MAVAKPLDGFLGLHWVFKSQRLACARWVRCSHYADGRHEHGPQNMNRFLDPCLLLLLNQTRAPMKTFRSSLLFPKEQRLVEVHEDLVEELESFLALGGGPFAPRKL
jgi:hypothetical protein